MDDTHTIRTRLLALLAARKTKPRGTTTPGLSSARMEVKAIGARQFDKMSIPEIRAYERQGIFLVRGGFMVNESRRRPKARYWKVGA